jgi:D-sedoheptulose 7-phosphate isomerase
MQNKSQVSNYFEYLSQTLDSVMATLGDGGKLLREDGIEKAIAMIRDIQRNRGKLYFIGNGASAAIASHQSADFTKAGNIPAMCFNDAALLTCLGNDLGYENVFSKPVEMYMNANDMLIAISSSGSSQNILNAVAAAKLKNAKIITLSGFGEDNALRQMGDLNFYANAQSYGHVEIAHHTICHCILDTIIARDKESLTDLSAGEGDKFTSLRGVRSNDAAI